MRRFPGWHWAARKAPPDAETDTGFKPAPPHNPPDCRQADREAQNWVIGASQPVRLILVVPQYSAGLISYHNDGKYSTADFRKAGRS